MSVSICVCFYKLLLWITFESIFNYTLKDTIFLLQIRGMVVFYLSYLVFTLECLYRLKN